MKPTEEPQVVETGGKGVAKVSKAKAPQQRAHSKTPARLPKFQLESCASNFRQVLECARCCGAFNALPIAAIHQRVRGREPPPRWAVRLRQGLGGRFGKLSTRAGCSPSVSLHAPQCCYARPPQLFC